MRGRPGLRPRLCIVTSWSRGWGADSGGACGAGEGGAGCGAAGEPCGVRPGRDRPDPIALLEEQAKSRVPELVPIRRGRMMVSPFTFYRGAALPMASDLSRTPVSGLAVQACGDAHLSNFGIFGSAERLLVFDVNDFDETTPGPWEWEVKRQAASMEVAARSGQHKKQHSW